MTSAALYIRHGMGWRRMRLPYTVLPRITKSWVSAGCVVRCGEVDRVLYFTETVSEVKHITAGVYVRYPNGRNEWVFGEMIADSLGFGGGSGDVGSGSVGSGSVGSGDVGSGAIGSGSVGSGGVGSGA